MVNAGLTGHWPGFCEGIAMHIVHILTRLMRAGSEENTLETCRWQVAAGHRVTLVHGRDSDVYWDWHLPHGVTRIAVSEMVHPVQPMQDLRALRALRQTLRSLDPDVIHTHQSKAGILGRMAARATPKALVVHGIHILPVDGTSATKDAFYLAAEKWVAGGTDAFIPVSRAVGQSFAEAGICDAERLHPVYSGMDLKKFTNAQRPADWRALLGVPPRGLKPPVVVMMAAFEPRKRHIPFLRAFARVAAALPDVRLILAGEGPEEARIRAEIAAFRLTDHVILTGHRTDPEALFALADISVLTSVREGLPRVVVQSIAAGCPVVAQALPGLDEIVAHGHNGWLVDAGDVRPVADRLLHFLTQPAQLAALRSGALDTDVSSWSLETLGRETTQIYTNLLQKRAVGRLHPA
ncbi:glycosyltransferase [Sulfitobacter aestuariivivens]|uniref:Glycosyltransferase n=1 Tax=Sulfitobacter aestuariivivens TaxID=2766981 RepID=A0A927HGE6_9RHOB|nr:glycosyltransferase [Sulfitobacter aestuariivivens]MBD3665394.1 glycosyltransferase [Sulfitobacter aestuariivivens]